MLRDRKLPAVDIEIENLDNSPDPEMSEEVVFEKKILPPGINASTTSIAPFNLSNTLFNMVPFYIAIILI